MASLNRNVTKVVIPVAGMGTRFMPVTKALPKELLPIVSTPIIHYIVEEAIEAGMETVVLVTSRPKILIEDYFDPNDLCSYRLNELGKESQIETVIALSKKIDIVSVRQYEPKGLGHAIYQAAPIVSGQNFSVILGDDLILTDKSKNQISAIAQCTQRFSAIESGSVLGTIQIPEEECHKYGILRFKNEDSEMEIADFVEKPKKGTAPSNWALPGRYVFEAGILEHIKNTAPGAGGEIQLTDAMQSMLGTNSYFAEKIIGERHDTGDKLGYIMANVSVALKDPKLKETFSDWLKKKLD